MASNQMIFNLGIKTSTDLSGINQLKASLKELATYDSNIDFITNSGLSVEQIGKSTTAVRTLGNALDSAFDVNLNGINFNTFQDNLKKSGITLGQIRVDMAQLGPTGEEAFAKATAEVFKMNTAVKYSNGLVDKLWSSLKSTLVYTGFNVMLNEVSSTISKAIGYVEKLDTSLNNIRIVSGQSADQMERFATQANNAAKALGTSTTDYTDAALIYYQQGLEGEDVTQRTDITTKMANVTGDSAQKVSEDLTAIWNNFYDGSKSLEYYADAITALGASTASSTSEISEGLEKFASIASTVGLSYEYATAAVATVVAETRQSADTVGTAFKTIFGRLEGLKLGETLEDGTSLNKYSEALNAVGINIKNSNGELKAMDEILDELGNRWKELNKDEQVALAQTVGGTRQYTQLISLMDNWETFKDNIDTARDSVGTLQQQQDTYMESTEAHLKTLKTASEGLYQSLFDTDDMNSLIDGATILVGALDEVVEAMDGLKNILPIVIAGFIKMADTKIATGISQMIVNKSSNQSAISDEQAKQKYLSDYNMGDVAISTNPATTVELEKQVGFYKEMHQYRSQMTPLEVEEYNKICEIGSELVKQTNELEYQQQLWNIRTKDNKILDIQFGADNQINLDKITTVMNEWNSKLQELHGKWNETEGDVTKMTSATLQWAESLNGTSINANRVHEIIQKCMIDEEEIDTEKLYQSFSKAIEPLQKIQTGLHNIINDTEIVHQRMDSLGENQGLRLNIQNIVDTTAAFGQLAMTISMLHNLGSIWKNEDISTGEKILQTIINVSMALGMLASAAKGLGLDTFFKAMINGWNKIEAKSALNAKQQIALLKAKQAQEEAINQQEVASKKLAEARKAYSAKLAEEQQLANQKLAAEKSIAIERERIARIQLLQAQKENGNAVTAVNNATKFLNDANSSTAIGADEVRIQAENELAAAIARRETAEKALIAAEAEYGAAEIAAVEATEAETVAVTLNENSKEASNLVSAKAAMAQATENVEKAKGTVANIENTASEVANNGIKSAGTFITNLATKAQLALNAAMEANPIGVVIVALTALVGIIALVAKGYDEAYLSAEEANEAIAKGAEKYNTATNELQDLQNKIDETNTKLKELHSQGTLSITDKNEIARLEAENALLESQIALKKEDQRLADEEVINTANEAIKQGSYSNKTSLNNIEDIYENWDDSDESQKILEGWLNSQNLSYEEYKNNKDIQESFYREFSEAEELWNKAVAEDSEELAEQWNEKYAEIFGEYADSFYTYFDEGGYDYNAGELKTYLSDKHIGTEENINQLSQEDVEQIKTAIESYTRQNSTGEYDDEIENLEKLIFDYYKTSNSLQNLMQSVIDSASNTITNEQLDNIYEIIHSKGSISNDELEEILSPQQLDFLQNYANAYNISLNDLLLGLSSYEIKALEDVKMTADEMAQSFDTASQGVKDGINTLLSGKEIENWESLEQSLIGVTDQYAELVAIRDKNSEAYLNRLISIREELDAQAISLNKIAANDIYDKLENTRIISAEEQAKKYQKTIDSQASIAEDKAKQYGAKENYQVTTYEVDTEDFEDSIKENMNLLNQFLDADYSITVSVKTDIENDFDTITQQMSNASSMAEKISDDFIVAGQDLRELNQQFPGILDGITYLADGTAKLSKESVETAIANSKAEEATAVQTAIKKIQAEQQTLLAKAAIYHAMGEIADKAAENESYRTQAVEDLKEQATEIDALNNAEVTDQKMQNEASIQDESAETGAAITSNMTQAYGIASEAALAFGDDAIVAFQEALTGVSQEHSRRDYSAMNDYYAFETTDNEEGSEKYETGQITNFEELTEPDQFKALADSYFAYEEELKTTANDMSGMIAELAAGVNDIDIKKSKGSKSSKKKDKEEKDFNDEFDRYWDINKALDKIADSMQRLDKIQSKLHGKELIRSLQHENELLTIQTEKYKELAAEQNKELSEINEKLGKVGFTFNGNGEMTNYIAQSKQMIADFNEATADYNAGKIDDDSYEKMSKEYEAIKKLVDRYDALIKERRDTQNNIDDNARKELENNLQAWEVDLELKLDTKEAERDWNDFIEKINTDFKSVYTDFTSLFRSDVFNANSLNSSIGIDINAIKQVEAEIDKMLAGGKSSMFESISEAQEKLKELRDTLKDDAESLFDLYQEGWENYLKAIDEAIAKMDEISEKYSQIDKQLSHEEKLIELLYGEDAYDKKADLYATQQESLKSQMRSYKQQLEFYNEQLAKEDPDSKAAQKWRDQIREAQNALMDAEESYAETTRKSFENKINAQFNPMLEQAQQDKENWEKQQALNDLYENDEERLNDLAILQAKWNKLVNNVKGLDTQKKLKNLMEAEMSDLENRNELTQYDIDLMEKKMAVAQAMADLEDAQNNKNTMKVTRGEDGNWSYQYVADDSQVEEKQLAYLQAIRDQYELTQSHIREVNEQMLDNQITAITEMKELYLNGYYNMKETSDKASELSDYYWGENGLITNQLSIGQQGMRDYSVATVELVAESCASQLVDQKAWGDEIVELNKTIVDSNLNNWLTCEDASIAFFDAVDKGYLNMNGTLTDTAVEAGITLDSIFGNVQSFTTNVENENGKMNSSISGFTSGVVSNFGKMFTDVHSNFKGMEDANTTSIKNMSAIWNGTDGTSFKGQVDEAVKDCNGYMKDFWNDIQSGCEAAGEDFTDITAALEAIRDAIEEVDDATKDAIDEAEDGLERYRDYLNELEEAWRSARDAIDEAADALEYYLSLEGKDSGNHDYSGSSSGGSSGGSTGINNGGNSSGGKNTGGGGSGKGSDDTLYHLLYGGMEYSNSASRYSLEQTITSHKGKGPNGETWSNWEISESPGSQDYEEKHYYKRYNQAAKKYDNKVLWPAKDARDQYPYERYELVQMNTGGYTGEWNNGSKDGKFAMLHQKELVLNADDTKNILNAVDIVRQLSSLSIEQMIANAIEGAIKGLSDISNVSNVSNTNSTNTNNNISIYADFPNANDVNEIKEALLSLPNLANQYISRQMK